MVGLTNVLISLALHLQLFGWIGEKFKLQMTVIGILSIMAVQGFANLQSQWGIIGEFSNFPQEELLEWIKDNTSPSEKLLSFGFTLHFNCAK